MPSVSRERVIEAVREYGLAWTTQDSKRIGRLFTEDAVYVERCFDKRATFRGRCAIEKYWDYQVCGKQSNICFRHVESEMVRDADRPIVVVKWLAEFDNRRERRSIDKENKRVRFCQMAKLIFTSDDDNQKICYLEEYAQGMIAKSFRWPGIDASDDELWDRIRFEPPRPPPPVKCEKCGLSFSSRTKLFAHLQSTEEAYRRDDDSKSEGKQIQVCVPKNKSSSIERVFVCVSISYTSCVDDPNDRLIRAYNHLISNHQKMANDSKKDLFHVDNGIELIWAVDPTLTSSAVVNVVTVKLQKKLVEQITIELLPNALNKALQITMTPENQSYIIECKTKEIEEKMIMVHTAGIVENPCSPQRRDFEKYVAYVPWKFLQTHNKNNDDSKNKLTDKIHYRSINNDNVLFQEKQKMTESMSLVKKKLKQTNVPQSKKKLWRRPLEESSAGKFVDAELARRLKHGARLMKNDGQLDPTERQNLNSNTNRCNNIKVRTSSMEEPMHHYCKISISIKQLIPGYVERLIALLVAYARTDMEESDLLTALNDKELKKTVLNNKSSNPFDIDCFPSDLVILLEPALSRYENKVKLKLCRNSNTNTNISKAMKESIDRAEQTIIDLIQSKEHVLKYWICNYGRKAMLQKYDTEKN